MCCDSWDSKELDTTERLNGTDIYVCVCVCVYIYIYMHTYVCMTYL